jgi:hypothetical protein
LKPAGRGWSPWAESRRCWSRRRWVTVPITRRRRVTVVWDCSWWWRPRRTSRRNWRISVDNPRFRGVAVGGL